MNNMDPTGSEIQQSEAPEYPAIRVQVETPVRIQTLPSVIASMGNLNPPDTDAHRLFSKDPRRRQVLLRVEAQTFIIATTQNEAQSGTGFRMPSGSAHTFFHQEEIWYRALVVSATTFLSYAAEYWSD